MMTIIMVTAAQYSKDFIQALWLSLQSNDTVLRHSDIFGKQSGHLA